MAESDKLTLTIEPTAADNTYAVGDCVTFRVQNAPTGGAKLRYSIRTDEWAVAEEGEAENGEIAFTATKPCVVRCDVWIEGAPAEERRSLGAVFSPAEILPSLPPPDDFDEFWERKLAWLGLSDLRPRITKVDPVFAGTTYSAEMPTPAGTVYAWIHVPQGEGPFPVVTRYHGAGVYAVPKHQAADVAGNGFIVVSVNSHPIPNDREPEFYGALRTGKLADYRTFGRESRETIYFVNMFLRARAALELAKHIPEWDGKTLISDGHSQGGGQAIAAAGLCEDVTALVASCPTHCDHTAYEADRQPGWPGIVAIADGKGDPRHAEASRYVDGTNFARRVKCPAYFGCCLLDSACSPPGILAAYNMLQGEKSMWVDPATGHICTLPWQASALEWMKAHRQEHAPINDRWKKSGFVECGVAKRKITPAGHVHLSGYGSRDKPSEGVYQDIWVKALAIRDGQTAVIVTSDVLYYDDDVLAPVERALAENPGLSPDQILVTATHTHCAPTVRVVDGDMFGPRDPDFIASLKRLIIEAAREAVGNLAPATLSYHRGLCDININRRVMGQNGIEMRPNPDGPVDHDVDVLVARTADGAPVATLVGYACHATTMGGYLIGGDYPGYMQEYVEAAMPGTTALFVQGCTGDLRPNNVEDGRFRSGPLEVVKEFGDRLGKSVVDAVEAGAELVTGPVRSSDVIARVPYMPPPTREELAASAKSDSRYIRDWAEKMTARLDAGEDLPTSAPVHVQALRLGRSFAMVAMAGEICVEIGFAVKDLIGDGPRFAIGYTNRTQGYIPSKSIHPEGGYEVNGAFYWEGAPAPYADTAEETLVATARRALDI